MRDRIHVKRSGLTRHFLVMQRGNIIFATRSPLLAVAVAALYQSAV